MVSPEVFLLLLIVSFGALYIMALNRSYRLKQSNVVLKNQLQFYELLDLQPNTLKSIIAQKLKEKSEEESKE